MPTDNTFICILLICLGTIHGSAIEKRQEEVCKVDLVIVADHSGSIIDDRLNNSENDWNEVKSFLRQIVDAYDVGNDATQIALLTFNDGVKQRFDFGKSKEEMKSVIDGLETPDGFTATSEALKKAGEVLNDGGRVDAHSAVLLLTDGFPTKNLAGEFMHDHDENADEKRKKFVEEAVKQSVYLRAETGAKILALGVTSQVNREGVGGYRFLENVADENAYYKADQFEELKQFSQQIMQESCIKPETPCNLDVAFAVDMSGSVDEEKTKNFMVKLSNELFEMDMRMRTALIRFANKARVFKYMNDYDPETMKNAIMDMSANGYTATPQALKLAKDEVFVEQYGDRPKAFNVMVIISDGKPTVMLDGTKVETYSSQSVKDAIDVQTEQLASSLKSDKNVFIISVMVEGDKGENLELLDKISSEEAIKVSDFDHLMGKIKELKDQICGAPETSRRRAMEERKETAYKKSVLEELLELLKKSKEEQW